MKAARAFAPATIGNVAVGFDILGVALSGIGETATVERFENSREVRVLPIEGFPSLPLDPEKNTAAAGLVQLIKDKDLNFGFRVHLEKKISVGSGLGGSAASAVAAVVAANSLLRKKLTKSEMLHYALIGEEAASGSRHGDNVAPCLYGGLVFVRNHPEVSAMPIRTPANLRLVVLLPNLTVNTKDARGILSATVPLSAMVEQTANLAGFLLGCVSGKADLIRQSLRDVVIEPQRARLIPHFSELQAAALKAGALGCSISGSGPAIFAMTEVKTAARTRAALLACAKANGLEVAGSWISTISAKGAHLLRSGK